MAAAGGPTLSDREPGRIILLNGASSAGKSTIARALQRRIGAPFWHFSIDHLREAGVLPMERIRSGEFDWPSLRPAFFDGFHACLPALARAGNHLIVEHIIETEAWRDALTDLLAGLDVFFVGVHCPLDELERREAARGDRRPGEARADFERVHGLVEYDYELDTTRPLEENVQALLAGWRGRQPPGVFERWARERGRAEERG